MTYRPNETVHCRFTGAAFTVVTCNGCVVSLRDGSTRPVGEVTRMEPYVSTAAKQFAPGNFVTTWAPELGRDAVGVTRAIEDKQEANPRVLVKWMHDLSEEWVRSEYLYVARA